ncbi:Ger(x)C family spore germination protein [Xylanibacillus composti]|nr:Ger(x)C family spore germination protein [Xylanibacillus composti]
MLVACALITSGCWDRIEIEERGFVIGVAIDFPKSGQAEDRADKEAGNKAKGPERFALTQQLVVPGALAGEGAGQGGDGGGKAYMNMTSEGDTILEMIRSTAARTSRSPFYEHIKIIIVSEEVAKSEYFASTLDYFIRYPEMRRGTKLFVSRGDARKVLEVEPTNEKLPAMYIDSISKNDYRNARMQPPVRIGEVHDKLLENEPFLIPRINADMNEVKIAGNSVFRDGRLAGFLGEEETEGLNFLNGQLHGGILEFEIEGGIAVMAVTWVKPYIQAVIEAGRPVSFTIRMQVEGNLHETLKPLSLEESRMYEQIEKEAEQEVIRLCELAVKKLQNEFAADVIGLGKWLKTERPKVWNAVKSEWNGEGGMFSQVSINIEPEIDLRNIGSVLDSSRMHAE